MEYSFRLAEGNNKLGGLSGFSWYVVMSSMVKASNPNIDSRVLEEVIARIVALDF